ncbi:hypothetical protein OPV22_004848 [Ensete ventricosum]|uniref:Uncharacterized protein n=1 Tax=Ensete ventricosum TaxID=4639 RepID=A0AAV8Q7I6_ENSVE|nr:hypothetical protein OPV22_004848 [Ensete ventricosum]
MRAPAIVLDDENSELTNGGDGGGGGETTDKRKGRRRGRDGDPSIVLGGVVFADIALNKCPDRKHFLISVNKRWWL